MNKHDLKAAAIVQAAFRNGNVMDAHRAHDGAVVLVTGGQAAAAASVVDKVVKESEAAQAQAAEELRAEASTRLVKHRDAILRLLLNDLVAAGQLEHADPYGLDAEGILKGFTFEDGAMEYEVNGKVIVTFGKPTVAFDAEFMNVLQQYRVAL